MLGPGNPPDRVPGLPVTRSRLAICRSGQPVWPVVHPQRSSRRLMKQPHSENHAMPMQWVRTVSRQREPVGTDFTPDAGFGRKGISGSEGFPVSRAGLRLWACAQAAGRWASSISPTPVSVNAPVPGSSTRSSSLPPAASMKRRRVER